MSGAKLDIRLLGPLEVSRDGSAIALPRSKKTRALLGYLTADEGTHGRTHLCDLLWDGPADPRAALRWSLSKLRTALEYDGVTHIVTDGDRVAFEPRGASVDLTATRAALGPDPSQASIETLEGALGCFRGDFLEGLDLPGCYRFDSWCAAQREAVRSLRVSVLDALADRLAAEPERALRYARDRLVIEPLAEHAHLAVIRLLARLGATQEALDQYERCRDLLKAQLGVRPSREMETLRAALMPAPGTGPTGAAPPVARASPAAALPPLFGRAGERAALEDLVARGASGDCDILVVLGEPGIGKTRLLGELAAMVRTADGDVLAGRAFEAERVHPYGAWLDVLRTIPADEVPASLRPELAPLLPELGAPAIESSDRNRLFEAIVRLLVGRAAERTVAVVLDDLHWADEPSAALLHFVARRTVGSRVLLACAARQSDLEDNPAAGSVLRDLRREDRLRALELKPLDHTSLTRLVHEHDAGADADAVFADSEGNPLFALELVRARKQGDEDLPRTLDGLIGDRLGRLDAEARNLLPWIAALGGGFRIGTLAQVTELPEIELLRGVEQFERRAILQPVGERYEFTHDLHRKVAYGHLSGPRRRLIHARIARTLSSDGIPEGELAEDLAHHAALAGDDELAARACVIAGWHCLGMFAYSEGAELAARGMTHASRLPESRRLPLRLRLLELYVQPGMEPHRPADFTTEMRHAITDARSAALPAAEVSGLYLISVLHYQSGNFGDALENTLRAEATGRGADPATAVRTIAETARCLGLLECEFPRAERLAREARTLAAGLSDGRDLHQIPMALGLLRHHAGELDEAMRLFERAARLARAEGERWWENNCLARLVMIELERDRPVDALGRCEEHREVASKLGEGSDASFADALNALASVSCDRDLGIEALDEAIAELRRADSQWMIAYAQSMAADLDLGAGRVDSARRRAEQALAAAVIVGRPSAVAVARALLARVALAVGDAGGAMSHVGRHHAELPGSRRLSARARAAVEMAVRQIAEIST